MSLPRPLLLGLVGAVLIGAAFFASRGLGGSTASDSAGEPVPPPAAVQPKPKAEAPATKDPRKALSGAEAVTSGTFNLHVSAEGVDLTGTGAFQSQGREKLPLFRIDLTGADGGEKLQLGAVSTGDKGYLVRAGKAVVVQPEGWDALSRARSQQAQNGPSREKFQGFTGRELDSMKFAGQETIDGTPVLHFRGQVDPAEARRLFAGMAEIFEKTSLDSPLPRRLASSVRGGTSEVWVGAEDHVIRRVRSRYEGPAGPFEIDFSRANLGEPQQIKPPAGASTQTPVKAGWDRDAFGIAFSALTLGVLTVEPSAGEPAAPARPERTRDKSRRKDRAQGGKDRAQGGKDRTPARKRARPVRTTPAAVKRAVDGRDVVVLLFRQRGADDDAVARSVATLRGRRGVTIFTIPVGQAPKYSKVGGSNVVRAPTIVLFGRDNSPRYFEGYIDATTLAQAVTDAR